MSYASIRPRSGNDCHLSESVVETGAAIESVTLCLASTALIVRPFDRTPSTSATAAGTLVFASVYALIVACVAHIPPVDGVTMDTKPNPNSKETIKQMLYEGIFTKMLQYEADQVFAESRKKTRIENFMTGEFSAEAAHIATQPPKGENIKR